MGSSSQKTHNMPLPAQISLSVELTKFLPLEPLVNTTGTYVLNLVRELQRSGSDAVVEEDLAVIFGRSRIESRFAASYRTIVAHQSFKPLHEALNIVLEGGAGPTVQRSLGKDADNVYFATVVQLSLLTFIFDINELTRGLQHALIKRSETISEANSVPAFDKLFGTLQAIQDQTASFNWRLTLDAVHSTTFPHIGKHRQHQCYLRCRLPVAILQGCLDFFAIVQRFPEERMVRINTSRHAVAELLVVWAHHVLGLGVTVCAPNGAIFARFGQVAENVTIIYDQIQYYEEDICLLDGTRDEIFIISQDFDDLEICAEQRLPCGVFGMQYLQKTISDRAHHVCVVQHAIRTCHSWYAQNEFARFDQSQLFRYNLLRAVHLLFPDLSHMLDERISSEGSITLSKEEERVGLKISHILFTFAFTAEVDQLQDLSLAVRAIENLPEEPPTVLRQPFENMMQLLLGTVHIKNALLVSSHGWCVYTNILVLPDPSRISLPLIHVTRGVPSRNGERRRHIVDGVVPHNGCVTPNTDCDVQQTPDPTFSCAFDISGPRWYVGITALAFEVLVTFELEPSHMSLERGRRRCRKMLRAGMLQMEQSAVQARQLLPCQHSEASLGSKLQVPENCCTFFSECRFQKNKGDPVWIFMALSAGNSQARWFCLLDALDQAAGRNPYRGSNSKVMKTYLRDKRTCLDCALNTIREENDLPEASHQEDNAIVILVL